MSKRKQQQEQELRLKAIAMCFVGPFMAVVTAQLGGFNICTGFFLLMTLASWVYVYLRIKPFLSHIIDSLPQRQPRLTPLTDESAPPTTPDPIATDGDARDIFL